MSERSLGRLSGQVRSRKAYAGAAGQEKRLALAVEGKSAGEGLQTMDEDDEMLSAMAASWWRGIEPGDRRQWVARPDS